MWAFEAEKKGWQGTHLSRRFPSIMESRRSMLSMTKAQEKLKLEWVPPGSTLLAIGISTRASTSKDGSSIWSQWFRLAEADRTEWLSICNWWYSRISCGCYRCLRNVIESWLRNIQVCEFFKGSEDIEKHFAGSRNQIPEPSVLAGHVYLQHAVTIWNENSALPNCSFCDERRAEPFRSCCIYPLPIAHTGYWTIRKWWDLERRE